jgi:hypothetical protein
MLCLASRARVTVKLAATWGPRNMMLFKYVYFEIGRAILEKNAIGFSQPRLFNDPFDLPSYPEATSGNPIMARQARIERVEAFVHQLQCDLSFLDW